MASRLGAANLRRAAVPSGPAPRRRRVGGFTLIELLIVMVVFGAMSAYAVMRSTPAGELTLPSQAQKMASDMRRVQSLASSWGQRLRVRVDAGSYSVHCASAVLPPCPAATSLAVTDPATASRFVVALQKGVVFVSPTTATLDINSLGQPTLGASFTLSGGSTKTVVVAPLTGFVAVVP